MNWLTFIVIVIFGLFFWLGMKKGLIKMIYSVGILAAGLLLTAILNPLVSSFLHHNNSIYQFVYDAVEENINLEGKIKTLNEENNVINELPLPELVRQKLKENNNTEVYEAMAVKSFKAYVYKYITNMILNGISYISVYILITVILYIMAETLDLISRLPVLKELNQLAGGAVGLLEGLLAFWIFCTVVAIFSSTGWAQKIYEMINQSAVLSTLYNGNLILKTIMGLKTSFFS
jgi:uncharacterized membrane protein required for colicin V production